MAGVGRTEIHVRTRSDDVRVNTQMCGEGVEQRAREDAARATPTRDTDSHESTVFSLGSSGELDLAWACPHAARAYQNFGLGRLSS